MKKPAAVKFVTKNNLDFDFAGWKSLFRKSG